MGRYSQPLARQLADWLEVDGRPARDRRRLRTRCADRRAGRAARCRPRRGRRPVARRSWRRAATGFPGVDVRQGARRVAAVRRRHLRRRRRVPGRPLHVRPGRRVSRDEAGDPARAAGSAPRSGTWPARGRRWRRCGRRSPRSRPSTRTRASFQGGSRESLVGSSRAPGCATSRSVELPVTVTHPTFEEWWEPYLHGVGPAGEAVAALDPDGRARLEEVAAPQPRRRAVRRHRGGVRRPRPRLDLSTFVAGPAPRSARAGLSWSRHDAQPAPPSPPQRGLTRPPRCGVWRVPVAPSSRPRTP